MTLPAVLPWAAIANSRGFSTRRSMTLAAMNVANSDSEDDGSGNEDEHDSDDSDATTTLIFNTGRVARSPTPENEVGISTRIKHMNSRRRKELRDLKAMTLTRRPACPQPAPLEQQTQRQPHPTDIWWFGQLENSKTPTETSFDFSWITGALFVGLLDTDTVFVTSRIRMYEIDDPDTHEFVPDYTFVLEFQVRVPPSSGFLCYFHQSPTFVLDAWVGLDQDLDAPLWTDYRVGPSPFFWTSRVEALELVRTCSLNRWNASQRGRLQHWCDTLTRGSFADRKFQTLHYPSNAAGPPPFGKSLVSPRVHRASPRTRYLRRRERLQGREESPTRGCSVHGIPLLNTV